MMTTYNAEQALIIIDDLNEMSAHLGEQTTWHDVYYAFLEEFEPDLIERNWESIKADLQGYGIKLKGY